MAAKSFVSRRGPNFIFPAPISCLGEQHLPLPASIYRGWGGLRACFHRSDSLLGIERLFRIAIPMIQGMGVTARSSYCAIAQRTSVRLYPCRYLICYLYRCELGWVRLFLSANLRIGNFARAVGKFEEVSVMAGPSYRRFPVYLAVQPNSLAACAALPGARHFFW